MRNAELKKPPQYLGRMLLFWKETPMRGFILPRRYHSRCPCRWTLRRDLRESYRRHTYRPQCGEHSYIHRTLRKAWFRIYSLTYQFNSFPTRFGVLIIMSDSLQIIKILKEEKLWVYTEFPICIYPLAQISPWIFLKAGKITPSVFRLTGKDL